MINQALYLTSEAHADPAILNLLRSQCDEVHVVSAIAQATALLIPSSPLSGSKSRHLIVADVAVGGLAFAECVVGLTSRFSPDESGQATSAPMLCARPRIVLIDQHGDVNVARRALRLGVDGYLLASDPVEVRLEMLRTLLAKLNNGEERAQGEVVASAGAQSAHGAHPTDGQGVAVGSADFGHLRLSQIEAAIISCLSAHSGLPLSARDIVNQVMGRDLDEDKAASLIRPHISRLRSKVEPLPQMPQRLLTVRGKGYMFVF